MRIAIIGFGDAGGATLKRLLTSAKHEVIEQITIFEPRAQLAVGLPYQADDPALILNSYAKDLSLNPDDPDEFLHFVQKHYPEIDHEQSFLPRQVYGEYMQSVYLPYLEDDRVNIVREVVTGIDLNTSKSQDYSYQVQSETASQSFDAVFLCLGHPPYADYYDLLGSKNYIHTPYPVNDQLTDFKTSDRIGIIGSSLTALDIAEFILENQSLDFPVTFLLLEEPFSTVKDKPYRGELTYSLTADWLDSRLAKDGQLSLEAMKSQILKDLASRDIDLFAIYERYPSGSLAEVKQQLVSPVKEIAYLSAYFSRLAWDLADFLAVMTRTDQQRFFREFVPIFNHFHGQMPRVKIEKVFEWIESGDLRMITGLKEITPQSDDSFVVQNNSGMTYEQDVMINATGFEMNLERATRQVQLIKQLYETELIAPHQNGGILVSQETGEPLSPRYGQLNHFYLASIWVNSTYFPLNNAQRIARLAARHVDTFYQHLS